MNIRQIALVANELAPLQHTLFRLLGIARGFHDPGVAEFGLHNVVMRIGSTYLEVVSPVQEGTTAGRYLQRRGGDSGYMVLVQVQDLASEQARLATTKIRTVWSVDLDQASAIHLHPADVPGAIASLDQMHPPSTWHWAGGEGGAAIPAADYADAILAAEIASSDPKDTAQKWSNAYGRELVERAGVLVLPFDATEIRFVPASPGSAAVLSGIDFHATDFAAVTQQAAAMNLPMAQRTLNICGTRLRFC